MVFKVRQCFHVQVLLIEDPKVLVQCINISDLVIKKKICCRFFFSKVVTDMLTLKMDLQTANPQKILIWILITGLISQIGALDLRK